MIRVWEKAVRLPPQAHLLAPTASGNVLNAMCLRVCRRGTRTHVLLCDDTGADNGGGAVKGGQDLVNAGAGGVAALVQMVPQHQQEGLIADHGPSGQDCVAEPLLHATRGVCGVRVHAHVNVNELGLGFSNTTRNPEGILSHNNRKS